jgi:hypothetical protein
MLMILLAENWYLICLCDLLSFHVLNVMCKYFFEALIWDFPSVMHLLYDLLSNLQG